ncbi:LCP family protein [Sediminispirochaeta smaragdinae]|uniref:Cell envelope-related transcriptional attenuator n=1 Tax=Sediminispirochaeta smaragdinae (strain DSM 11293 / JCM 15392 / SEBR 4228) TaxID=573413 RepID=E1R3B0_SEDSS|nr:LCP family protein [Sediminispirochaeta smaragdinae]ADK81541.1 cell envelope-related transcriptional attenuator [Sediminispirochaeta smaragdinae DSM 11293]
MRRTHLLLILVCIVFVAVFLTLFFQVASLRREQQASGEKLFAEIESQNDSLGTLKRAILSLGQENNTLRQALNLPEKRYDFFGAEDASVAEGEPAEGIEKQEDQTPFYRAVDALLAHDAEMERAAFLSVMLENSSDKAFLSAAGISMQRKGRESLLFSYASIPLATFHLLDTGYRLNQAETDERLLAGNDEELGKDAPSLPKKVLTLLASKAKEVETKRQSFAAAQSDLRRLYGDGRATALRRERALRFSPITQDSQQASFDVTTWDGILLFSLKVRYGSDGILVGETQFQEFDGASDHFLGLLTEADNRRQTERATDAGKQQVLRLVRDEAFRAYLDIYGLHLNDEPRDENDYFYFDFIDEKGSRAGSLAVQKMAGEIYLMDRDDVVVGSVRRFGIQEPTLGTASTMELPDDAVLSQMGKISPEGKTILLCGTHENNADTIIIAHISPEKATLIAIPRDIWWKKRKINSYFRIYGPKRFAQIVGEMTGLTIDDYIVVDMYAFIDVINILGGIEVTLEQPLIDPTYRIRENGEWTTLHYPAGTHLLDGVAALRVARSRHTSDDFDRAQRQQLVIEGIKKRFDQLGAGEVKTVYELLQSLASYIDTSFSPFELARLYLENRHIMIENGGGISTDNVLLATYSNLLATGKREDEVDEHFDKGAWILIPRENNWKLIPWYVNKLIEGDKS